MKLTCRSSSGLRPEGLVMSASLIPEPAQRGRGSVVTAAAGALHGARAELKQLRAQLPGRTDLGCDLGVGEQVPQSVGARPQTVVRLQRAATRQRHVRQDRIPAEATLDEVAHRMVVRL